MTTWVNDGRTKLEKLLAERHIDVSRGELDKAMESVLEPYRLKTIDDLLAEIGFGSISPLAALTRMNPDWSKARRPPKEQPAKLSRRTGTSPVSVEGVEDMQSRIANCCAPIPGDEIVGYITRGRGISIHKSQCRSIVRMREDEEDAARIVQAKWNDTPDLRQNVMIRVEAGDRTGLLAEISQAFAMRNVPIISCITESDQERRIAAFVFKVDVANLGQLEQVLGDLRQIDRVYKALRTMR